jgi:PEP-CTERM motif
MTKIALHTLAAAVVALATAGPASANYTLDVSAALRYGGTLTGTLTFASATSLNAPISYDLVASAGPGSPGFTFPGFEYTTGNSSITAETSTLIQFDSLPAGQELRLDFAAPLTAAGATLATSSYESEIVAGNRTVTSGSVFAPAAVPEPGSLALLGLGLASAGAWAWRRRAPGRIAAR